MKKYALFGGLIALVIGVLVTQYSVGDNNVQLVMQSPSEVATMFEIRSEGKPENYKKAADEIIAFYENMTPKLDEQAKLPWKQALCDVLRSKGTVAAGIITSDLDCALTGI